jgi:hypothetical protein
MQRSYLAQTHSVSRRQLLVTSIGAVTALSVANKSGASSTQNSGIVWTRLDDTSSMWTDIVPRTQDGYIICGKDDMESHRAIVRTADQWGRVQGQRRGDEWGDKGAELIAHDDRYLLAGIEDNAPLLIGFPNVSTQEFLVPDWRSTYNGVPSGSVHVTATADGYNIGWTEEGDLSGSTVVQTDRTGGKQWIDRLASPRRLAELVQTSTTTGWVAAAGPHEDNTTNGWATVWEPDGTRSRDRLLDTPGGGPSAVVTDESAVVMAGSNDDGWWLQRRASDWSIDRERQYADDGGERQVTDLVRLTDGYGLLGYDTTGTRLIRTDDTSSEQWRGHYTPYDQERTARGRSIIPVGNDEFIIIGSVSADADESNGWIARVGEPGQTTPSPPRTPTPTTTGGEYGTMPDPATRTSTPLTPTTEGGESSPVTETPKQGDGSTESSGGDTPGFGIMATLAGVVGWVVFRQTRK